MVSAAGKLPDAEYSTANLGRPGSPYGTDCNAADMMKKKACALLQVKLSTGLVPHSATAKQGTRTW